MKARRTTHALVIAASMCLPGLFGGCSSHAPGDRSNLVLSADDEVRAQLINQRITAAVRYLAARQSPDGSWRSGVYGFFKDGATLTPHVFWALHATCAADDAGAAELMRRAAAFLASVDDAEHDALIYPVYTAAQMSLSSASLPRPRETAARWTALLRNHQLIEPLGWTPDDAEYGGWGYAQSAPVKPQAGTFRGPWDWSNLTATTWALEALHAAGAGADDPACRRALAFVQRCQNFDSDSAAAAADGGFFFSPTVAMRNKAGLDSVANRFNSYGSMTCDGIRALLACGVPPDDPRIVAARHWIESNFDVAHNPGRFVAANEDLRDSIYYYYAWSLSRTLRALGCPRELATPRGRVDWADALSTQLMIRQRPDGSWANRFTDGKEDDPLIATPLALLALVNCRDAISNRISPAVGAPLR
jgi:hypothetical protein